MASNALFAEVAALAGDPARAGMLHALMDGRALSASELARVAGITPQTATGHLARMTAAGLLRVEKQGRHHYHRLATPAVAQMMESIMRVASDLGATRPKLFVGPRDAAMRAARTCYDHLAGRLGVALADALVAGGHAELASDGGVITNSGVALLGRRRYRRRRRSESVADAGRSVSCAGRASIGASGGRISRDRSARKSAARASRRAGYAASTARAPSPSRPRDTASFASSSARSSDE